MGRSKKPTAAEMKKIRLVKMIQEVTSSGSSKDTWNPAEISEGLKNINFIRRLVDTWNSAQLNEAIRRLGFKTIDTWNPAIIDEMKAALIRIFALHFVTGNPITLNLTGELPYLIKEASVTFSPKQSGTGEPSPTNIRPISGWDGLNLNVSDGETEGTDYPATFESTVPGGTYDFVSGEGEEVWKDYLINDLTLTYSSSGQLFTSQEISGLLSPASSREMIDGNMCEFLKNHEVTGLESGQFAITTDGRIRIKIDGYTTEEDLKAAFGSNKLTLKLATPTPIELTAQEVEPLPGINVFSTDADTLNIKYQIDLS